MDEFSLIKIKVNDEYKPLKHIASYKVQLIDIDGDGAGTSEDGYTIRDVRRRNKAKITVRFDGLTLQEFTELSTYIDSESFDITYFRGKHIEATVHAGDRNIELIKAINDEDSRWRVDTSFIEY